MSDYIDNLEQQVDSLEFQVEQLKNAVHWLIGYSSVPDPKGTPDDYDEIVIKKIKTNFEGIDL